MADRSPLFFVEIFFEIQVLLDRDTLGQVTWLIYIRSKSNCNVVSEQLEWHDIDNRLQLFRDARNTNDLVRHIDHFGFVPVGHDDDNTIAGSHLLHVAEDFLENPVASGQGHDRKIAIDESDRPMFHLACRVALGMDVGDLLELQCTLESDRIVETAPDVEKVPGVREATSQLLVTPLVQQNLAYGARQMSKIRCWKSTSAISVA